MDLAFLSTPPPSMSLRATRTSAASWGHSSLAATRLKLNPHELWALCAAEAGVRTMFGNSNSLLSRMARTDR
eukprot:1074288-Pyramimonas_sp.AAC.1